MPSPAAAQAHSVAAPIPATPAVSRVEAFPVRGRHIYMIGIGGCGMAGLARMLSRRGAIVSGSDLHQSETTDALDSEGIRIGFDQSRSWLPGPEEGGCDLVVASAAIKPDHPQMLEANRRGIPTLMYAEALGKCMLGRTGIAVAGTHGKSTTTAMLGTVLTDAGLDPTVIVGATCAQLERGCLGKYAEPAELNAEIAEIPKSVRTHTPSPLSAPSALTSAPSSCSPSSSGFRLGADSIPSGPLSGRPGILIAEACEFNRSFHNYRPLLASISSVEADHLDVYGTLDAVVEAFHEFAKLIAPSEDGGTLLIAHDGAHRREITAGLKCNVETIGFSPEADWVVDYDLPTRRVSLTRRGTQIAAWTMTLPGVHNGLNAATALALAVLAGADAKRVASSLSAFRGVDRRMQFLGEKTLPSGGHVRIFDDYGHHPTEVATTLKAFRDFERPQDRGPKGGPPGRLICVFQPHQHSRTRHLLEEFATAFGEADIVIVPHIYFVRDSIEEKHKVTAADLVDRLRQRGQRAMHLYPFEAIVEQLENLCRDGDVLVCMGAGPVYEIARAYLNNEPRA